MRRRPRILGFALLLFFLSVAPAQAEKSPHHEVTALVSLFTGDVMRSTKLGGGAYTYRFNQTWWVGFTFLGGKAKIDEANGTDIENGDRFMTIDGAVYFNLPALLGASKTGDGGRWADLYFSLGGGHAWMGPEKAPYGFTGGGMVLHTGWAGWAVRFDLKGLLYALDNDRGSDFVSDFELNLGPAYVF